MPATYEPIATTTLGSAASSIDFTSIAASYTDLRVVLIGTTASATLVNLRFNSDTATNYSGTMLTGDGSAAASERQTTVNRIVLPITSENWGTSIKTVSLDIFSYAGSTNKTLLSTFSGDTNGAGYVIRGVHLWRNTAAITSINLIGASANWAAGTTATLYGILKA
jgi:hypothetical protein